MVITQINVVYNKTIMKLAIVVDSSCGLSKKEAEKRGWYYLPIILNIDGKDYQDGIDITSKNFLKIYKEDSIAKTACTPIGVALELIEKLSKENDFVVIYPISQGLSSQCQNLIMISKQHKNVFVIKSKNVFSLMVKELVELEKDVLSNELTVKQAIKRIEDSHNEDLPDGLLFPRNLNSLVKGGRLSPSAAKLAKLLRIFPVIGLQNGNLEKYDKGITFNKTFINNSIDLYKKSIKKYKPIQLLYFDIASDEADDLFDELTQKLDYKGPILRFSIPPVIAIHTGPNSLAIMYTQLKFDIKEYNFD